MGLGSPWFLAGFIALGLPLWLHLLRRFKQTPQPFSSLMFFERRVQSSVRHRRLRYLALLALRLLLLALLALAFANPYFLRRSTAQAQRKLTVIVIDRSFSMRANGHMERAKEEARQLVNALPGGFIAQVAGLDSHLEALTTNERDREPLNAAIDQVAAGDQVSSYGELARALRRLGNAAGMQIDAHFISDMQQSSLPEGGFRDLQLDPGTGFFLHSVGEPNKENWAVESATVVAQIFDPKTSRLTATIAGWQTPAANRQVSLVMNGRTVETKTVAVPANGRAQVEFLGFDVPYGQNHGEVRLDSHDALPGDNGYLFSIERSDPKHVLFLYSGGRSREALYYKAAMESSPNSGLIVETAPLEQAANIDLTKFVFVVLSDPGELGSDVAGKLRPYVERGGGLLISLGANTARAASVPVTGDRLSAGDETMTAGEVDPHQAAVLDTGRFENVRFFNAIHLEPKPTAKVIAKFSNGSPLLIEERVGEGRVLTFSSMLDNSSGDFPLHASYVPFVAQSGMYLAGAADVPSSMVVGSPAILRRSKSETTAADIVGPSGKHELSLNEASQAMSYSLSQAGFYDVQSANGRRSLLAVNPDRRESDLALIPDETLELWRNTGSTASGQGGTAEQAPASRWSFWRYLLILALLAALVESVFASRYLTDQKEAA